MKKERAKMILEAAAMMPPAKGRALVRAVAAKDARVERDVLAEAAETLALAMELAALDELERSLP